MPKLPLTILCAEVPAVLVARQRDGGERDARRGWGALSELLAQACRN